MQLTQTEIILNGMLILLFLVMGIVFLLGKGNRFLTFNEDVTEEDIRMKSRRSGLLIEVACLCQIGNFFGRGYRITWLSMVSSLIMVLSLMGLVVVAGEAKEKKKKKK